MRLNRLIREDYRGQNRRLFMALPVTLVLMACRFSGTAVGGSGGVPTIMGDLLLPLSGGCGGGTSGATNANGGGGGGAVGIILLATPGALVLTGALVSPSNYGTTNSVSTW